MNLQAVANSLIGGDVIAIAIRSLIRMKARAAALAFKAQVMGLAQENQMSQIDLPAPTIGDIPISTKKQEAYIFAADVTKHTIEAGSILSDHVILQPAQIDILFEITNYDLAESQWAFNLFKQLLNDRESIDLVTVHATHPNMVLTRFEPVNSVPNWGALDCHATFMQVGFFNLEVSSLPTDDKTKQVEVTGGPDNSKSATGEKSAGKVTPKDSPPNGAVKGL